MNPIYQAILAFFVQIAFLYFRTLNIKFTSRGYIFPAVLSGMGVQTCWLVAMFLGVKNMMEGNWIVPIAYLLGGAIGTYLGMRLKK